MRTLVVLESSPQHHLSSSLSVTPISVFCPRFLSQRTRSLSYLPGLMSQPYQTMNRAHSKRGNMHRIFRYGFFSGAGIQNLHEYVNDFQSQCSGILVLTLWEILLFIKQIQRIFCLHVFLLSLLLIIVGSYFF